MLLWQAMQKTFPVQLVVVAAMFFSACGGSPTGPDSDDRNVQGVWQGTWLKSSCTGVGCDVVPVSGGLRLTLTQAGNAVQGTVELASFVIPASGSVSNATLSLTGTTNQGGATATLSSWNTTRSGSSLAGGFTLTIVPDNPQFGPQTVGITLQNVSLTS